jgi:hypothetical protein
VLHHQCDPVFERRQQSMALASMLRMKRSSEPSRRCTFSATGHNDKFTTWRVVLPR